VAAVVLGYQEFGFRPGNLILGGVLVGLVIGRLGGLPLLTGGFSLTLPVKNPGCPRSQPVAVQQTNRCLRTGTAPAKHLNQNNKGELNMALNVSPIGDRILVEPVEEKENRNKKGTIIIPDTAKEKSMESMVVALGTGKTDDNGKKVPFDVKKGDRVLVNKYGGTEIKLDGKDYKILNSDDILAVIE
jgi:chaperonin GroES